MTVSTGPTKRGPGARTEEDSLQPARSALVATTVAALAALATPALAQTPKAAVQGVTDTELRDAIERAVGEAKSTPQTRFEARRRARDAAEDAIAALRTQGYYAYEVQPDVIDRDEDGGGEPPRAVLIIKPGPRFRFAGAGVEWVGAEPLPEVIISAEQAMAIRRGAAGKAADVLAAEGRIVAAIQKRGYADAEPGVREVIVDHADHTVRPTFRIVAGERVMMDGVTVEPAGRTGPAWVVSLAPWKPGDVYNPEQVAELERRLLDTGVYDSVSVTLRPADKADAEGRRPVLVALADRPMRTLELSAGYSTSEGAGLDVRRTRYNQLGRADTVTYTLRLAELEQRFEARLTLPHWRRPQQTLTMVAGLYDEQTDAYDAMGFLATGDVTRRFGKTSFVTAGLALDASRSAEKTQINNATIRGAERDILTGSVLGAVSLDRSDDPLDPTRGWRIEARAEPTVAVGDLQALYFKVQAQGSAYFSLDEDSRTILATRLKLGSVFGATLADVAAPRRFYAGGGGSVRGYAWQAIGPRLADNTPQGGLSVFEASFEGRYRLTGRWGVVVFIDAGAIGTDAYPQGDDFSVGAGLGVRYDLGFGPIRADIAVPLDKREGDADFQIYISIGQAF